MQIPFRMDSGYFDDAINETILQLLVLAYNLFLLFKMEFAGKTEYQQQIKSFRWKVVFLAEKVIRTESRVAMKLLKRNPHRKIYKQSLSG